MYSTKILNKTISWTFALSFRASMSFFSALLPEIKYISSGSLVVTRTAEVEYEHNQQILVWNFAIIVVTLINRLVETTSFAPWQPP